MLLPRVKDEPATAARVRCRIRGKRLHSGAFLLLVLVVSAMPAVTGCGASAGPTGTATATATGSAGGDGGRASDSLVMIIRHGEKPSGSTPGVDARGNPDAGSLTDVGWNRARRLVDLFDPADGHLRAGLARPEAIYAAGANSSGEGVIWTFTKAPDGWHFAQLPELVLPQDQAGVIGN